MLALAFALSAAISRAWLAASVGPLDVVDGDGLLELLGLRLPLLEATQRIVAATDVRSRSACALSASSWAAAISFEASRSVFRSSPTSVSRALRFSSPALTAGCARRDRSGAP